MVSSIRSKQTGQVGISTRAGVGGASGFVDKDEARAVDSPFEGPVDRCELVCEAFVGVKGSLIM